jgi:hypothetical protein
MLALRAMFQQSAADIQRQVERFMSVAGKLDHDNHERLRDLHGSMAARPRRCSLCLK